MTRSSSFLRVLAFVVLCSLTLWTPGCSDDDDPAAPSVPTHFEGIITNGSETGTLVLDAVGAATAAGAAIVNAAQTLAGTLTIAGGPSYDVTCTLDGTSLQCGAGPYSIVGTLASGSFSGSYTGPSGDGVLFLVGGDAGSLTVYCGEYTGTDDGTFNIVRNGNALAGIAVSSSGNGGALLSGTVSGSSITITFEGGSASGTIEGTAVGGTWETNEGDSGEWFGSSDACGGGVS